jgi:uncharacterized protein (TIRG00374 family)
MGEPREKDNGRGLWHWFSLALRICVTLGVLVWVLGKQDWGELVKVFQTLRFGPFVFVTLVFVSSQVLLALRWWILLFAQEIRISLWAAVRLHFLGLFYNNVMPSSIGGDVIRAWYVSKHTEKKWAAALSVLFDRVWGLVGLILIAVTAYVFLFPNMPEAPDPVSDASGMNWFVIGLSIVSVLSVGGLILAGLCCRVHTRRWVMRAAGLCWLKICTLTVKAKEALWLYIRTPKALFAAMMTTFLLQSMVIIAFWYLGRSLGIDAGLDAYFVIFPITWVLGALPISISGWGVLEGGITHLFVVLQGVEPEQALTLALCQRIIWILGSLPGSVIHLRGAHLPKSFSFDPDKMEG